MIWLEHFGVRLLSGIFQIKNA